MEWPVPEYSRKKVALAGKILAEGHREFESVLWAYEVLSNWRACHGYPVNTFQATLRQRLKHIDPRALVAQRLKRTPSVINKLRLYPTMSLARMQDIVGLRAVVGTLSQVRLLQEKYTASRFKHELVGMDDYISLPKESGYRSIHLVYRYKNDLAPAYNGLLLELQIRTRLQHAWATAVETMSTFLGQALKSSQGELRWLKFFEIVSCAFSILERSPVIPSYSHYSRDEIFRLVARTEAELGVLDKLNGFQVAMQSVSSRGRGHYHLIILDSKDKTVDIRTYSQSRLEEAAEEYKGVESRIGAGERLEAVLVSAGPIESLRRAYPNYFLDTQDFIRRVKRIIKMSEEVAPAASQTGPVAPRGKRA